MEDYSFTCPDAASTAAQGARLGPLLKRGDVVLLYGDLGAGKTTFIRGLIQHLSAQDTEVVSPTFTLVQTYPTAQSTIYHYDLYRLPQGADDALIELGWDDGILDGITLVEWPERLSETNRLQALTIELKNAPDGGRILTYRGDEFWIKRLQELA
jgi:tRNA threonylcarbamoyladenosine biosynthesis protein TsaE